MTRSENEPLIPTWKVHARASDYEWIGHLVAYWEVALDPISDNYTPSETDAKRLLELWAKRALKEYPNGLIPIHWFVKCVGEGKLELMPFQFKHLSGALRDEDFLIRFSWPIHVETEEPLNWLKLPVVDKLWAEQRADKGGFIQQATGWKPSILQPYVYLPALTRTIRN